MTRLLWIGLGGALGTLARYGVGLWAGRTLWPPFPFATLIVNVVGCFLIAFISQIALSSPLLSPTARLTLTTGFMGGLTTYSTFNLETTRLIEQRTWTLALANLAATIGGCFVAGLVGLALGRRVFGA